MDEFPWWSEKHSNLLKDAEAFADKHRDKGTEIAWNRKFPKDILNEAIQAGWFGALIPEEYGGIDAGATGCCIIAEQLASICVALAGAFSVTMFGGTDQLIKFGTAEQKSLWLPRVAKGTIGAVCITEPFAGSDAASIETTATREKDGYIINGKKRFITNAGLADIYLVYAKTSEDKTEGRHLSSFIVEKGVDGFTVEKINELGGWPGLLNGYLDFQDVYVSAKNRIGEEGDGWRILLDSLNFERTLFSAERLGPMKEALKHAVFHSRRRLQFGRPIIDWEVNQFKIADIITGLRISRLAVYYAAHLLDLGADSVLDATLAKLYVPEAYERVLNESSQIMGGDGWTRFYPVETSLRDSRVNYVSAGTSEVMRMVIFRAGMKALAKDFKMPTRIMHEKMNVPIASPEPRILAEADEQTVLSVLAEDYRVNPGLYMSKQDIEARFDNINEEQMRAILTTLEEKRLVRLYRNGKNEIKLAKATYAGLRKANPKQHYQWYPSWVDKEFIF